MKELKKEDREKADPMMLPRNGINTTKKLLKKQNSYETNVIKIKNLPIALQRQESLPVNSNEYATKVASLQMKRLQTAKPKTNPKLQAPPKPQCIQTNKSPRYKVSNGLDTGVQINSNKNFNELNENLQSLQKIMGGQGAAEYSYATEQKQPFALLNNNIPAPERSQLQVKPQPLKQEMEMEEDDGDQDSQGLEQICHNHESLVNLILQEEEELLGTHRKYIDDIVDSVKTQMMLLNQVDKPGSNVEDYISSLDTMLLSNVSMITGIRKKLKKFERHLKEEEQLSQKFYEQQQDEDMQQNDCDDYQFEPRRKPGNSGNNGNDFEDDEFMDDLYDLDVTPSEPPVEDNLIQDVDF